VRIGMIVERLDADGAGVAGFGQRVREAGEFAFALSGAAPVAVIDVNMADEPGGDPVPAGAQGKIVSVHQPPGGVNNK
jgi:hypothetical protein